MGKHYVPQEYLRGFAHPRGADELWMYDRAMRTWSFAAIKRIAQERDYYPPDVEKDLAEQIEHPGHAAIRRLRSREGLDPEGRRHLAAYIGVMFTRGPRRRRKGRELAPEVFASVLAETREELGRLEAATADTRIPRVLAELARIEASYMDDPAAMIKDQIESPWASADMIDAVSRMVWRFMLAPAGEYFVTTDNPAFYFDGYGVGTALAELTFAVSSDILLLGSHQGTAGSTLLIESRRSILKEANRRMISGAERFIFSCAREEWIETVAARSSPYLSRFIW